MSKKILVIDDDVGIAKVAVFLLKKAGYEVFYAEDTKTALESIDIDKPDLIFLDLHLGDEPGEEICIKVKSDEATKATPVILLTATDDDIVLEIINKIAAQGYVKKPFTADDLIGKVKEIFG